jgi:trigger factor
MKVTAIPTDAGTVQATVTLDAVELNGALERVRTQLAKSVTVEGFRKGTAPKHLAERELNEQAVRAEALEFALGDSFSRAATQEGWDVQQTDNLKVIRNDETGLEYEVRVRLWPAIALADLSSVKVERRQADVLDAEVDEALETLRGLRATHLDKTGPAASGDRVEVDFDASVGGIPLEGGSSRNHPLVIGGKSFMPGFEEALVGLTAGTTHRFTLTAPPDYYEQTIAGKQVDFSVTMRRVQAVLKPALDDVFAKASGLADVAALRTAVRDGLVRDQRSREQGRVRLAALDALIAASKVPAPEHMVDSELDSMVHRFSHDLSERGVQLPLYLARLQKTEQQLRDEWKPEAQRQVRIGLVLRAVIAAKGITIAAGEVDEAVKQVMAEAAKSTQSPTADPERMRGLLEDRMLRERALQAVESSCVA